MRKEVWVLICDAQHGYGPDVTAWATQEEAQDAENDWLSDLWDEKEMPGKFPGSDDEAVQNLGAYTNTFLTDVEFPD